MKAVLTSVAATAAVAGVVALGACTGGGSVHVTADQVTDRMWSQMKDQPSAGSLALKCTASKVDSNGFGSYACDLTDKVAADNAPPSHLVVQVTPDGKGWQIQGDTGTAPGGTQHGD